MIFCQFGYIQIKLKFETEHLLMTAEKKETNVRRAHSNKG